MIIKVITVLVMDNDIHRLSPREFEIEYLFVQMMKYTSI